MEKILSRIKNLMKKLLGIVVLCYRIFSNLKAAGLNQAKQ